MVAYKVRGCFKNRDWLLYSSRGRVRGEVRIGDLGSFRSCSSRDCIKRRRWRLSRFPVGRRDLIGLFIIAGLFYKRVVLAPRLRLAGV